MADSAPIEEFDVLVVGAGYAGLYQLDKLRKLGHNVHVFESAGGLGGVWYWNCYPGARTDSPGPMYQFGDEALWRDWNFSELYPTYAEVREYFEYMDRKLDLTKDVSFSTTVTAARFDEGLRRWRVEAQDTAAGTTRTVHARYVVLCTGFGSKPFTPEIPGLETFEGECYHTARWPQDREVPLAGRRIGVIGNGASGVQVMQEAAKVAEHITLFQRTPMFALPMRQRAVSDEENAREKATYAERMTARLTKFGGVDFGFIDKNGVDVSDEERRATYEQLWEKGGFYPWLGTFQDMFFNPETNKTFYEFWKEKTRARITKPELWEVLAESEGHSGRSCCAASGR